MVPILHVTVRQNDVRSYRLRVERAFYEAHVTPHVEVVLPIREALTSLVSVSPNARRNLYGLSSRVYWAPIVGTSWLIHLAAIRQNNALPVLPLRRLSRLWKHINNVLGLCELSKVL